MPIHKIEASDVQREADDIKREMCAICLESYLDSIKDYGVVFVKTISCFH